MLILPSHFSFGRTLHVRSRSPRLRFSVFFLSLTRETMDMETDCLESRETMNIETDYLESRETMNIKTDYLESFAQVQILYHEVYPLFTFSNSCFNFHANTSHGYSKARRVLSKPSILCVVLEAFVKFNYKGFVNVCSKFQFFLIINSYI